MIKIAHLTDLHLLEGEWAARRGAAWMRLGFCSLLRARDAEGRRARVARALRAADTAGADHVVVTGDLTEDGADAQFEVLGELLRESGLPPDCVTVVPGNHDAYTDGAAFARALAGPLRAYAPTSAPGAVKRTRQASIVALSTAVRQHCMRATGVLGEAQLARVEEVLAASRSRGSTVVLAQHHSPRGSWVPASGWIDGLRDHRRLRGLLERWDNLHVLHGHIHRAEDHAVRPGGLDQVFSARAVVDSPLPLRLYWAGGGRLYPVPRPAVELTAVLAVVHG